MQVRTLLKVGVVVLLASCATPSKVAEGVSAEKYESLSRGNLNFVPTSPLHLRMTIRTPREEPVKYASQKLSLGKRFRFGEEREFVYPSAYFPAEVSNAGLTVAPVTPSQFETIKTGLVADLSMRKLGGLVVLEGTIVSTEFQGFSRMGGALGTAILDSQKRVLSENLIKMPKFARYETPVFVALEPGKESTIELSAARKGVTATFLLEP